MSQQRFGLRIAVSCLALSCFAACGDDGDKADAGGGEQLPADSWSTLGFDLSSTFNNPHEAKLSVDTVKDLEDIWQLSAVGSVTGTPCIIGEHAYVVSQGRTYKLDVATGKEVWTNKSVAGTSSPACTLDTVYVDDASAVLHALDAKTGKELWKVDVDEHPQASGFSSPVVAGDKVIVGTSSTEETSKFTGATFRGSVVAFDRDTGKELWRRYMAENDFTGATVWSTVSVSLEDEIVYASTGNNYTGEANELSDALVAMDLETGEILWSKQCTEGDVFTVLNSMGNPDADFGTNPILFEAEVDGETMKLVGAGQKSGVFWVLDRMTGKVVWNKELSGGSAGTGGILNNGAFDGERIITASNLGKSTGAGSEDANGQSGDGTARLVAMDAATGDIVWERQLGAFVWAPITIANGVGFVSVNQDIQAFDTKTGEKLWSKETAGTIGGGAAIAGGRVLFGSGFTYTGGVTPDTELYALEVP